MRTGELRRRFKTIADWARPSLLPAAIAATVIVVAGHAYERQDERLHRNELHARVATELSLISARLEGEIKQNVTALQGLANMFAADPEQAAARFNVFARKLLVQNVQFRRVAAAPDAVVAQTFPLWGNEHYNGTDLDRFPSFRIATEKNRVFGRAVLLGPVQLSDGLRGFNLVIPVFGTNAGSFAFWGYIEGVIDERRLFKEAGLVSETDGARSAQWRGSANLSLSIRDVSDVNGIQDSLFGNQEIFNNEPVKRTVEIPGGAWELAAIPSEGWETPSDNLARIRITTIGAAFIIILPIFLTGGLVSERQRHVASLRAAKEQADSQKESLVEITQRLDMALDAYQCGLWEADLDRGGTYWDERMHQLCGLEFSDGLVTEEVWLNTIHPEDRQAALENVNKCIDKEWPYVQQARIILSDGELRHVRSVGKVHRSADGSRKLVGIAFDVTDDVRMTERLRNAKEVADAKNAELELAKNRIEHNALHDPLTGLGNRRKLDDHLKAIADRSRRRSTEIGILHIDLDRFKQINDTLGHAAGDALLVHAADILRASVRAEDLVARIGGDEFVVVVAGMVSHADLTALSQRIIGLMRQPVDYQGHSCRFGVSIGVATGSGMRIDARKLLVNADIALYRAKALGRNRHEFFNAVLEAEIITNKRMADDILAGIEDNEFIPYYQPQICARTLKLAGVEALIRWRHPKDGLLLPDRFLRIAEDLNVMATLDRIMLEKALVDCSLWATKGIILPKISVNVSARRLRDETLVESLTGLSIMPGQISFELVESIFLDETDDVVLSNIERIKELGIDIEIDDFGTGHTSIVSLLKLRPKRLKIDRQLVGPILTSRHEQALVRSIIDIGRSLGIQIVAEGVETMAHAEMLSALGCDLLQGFAFGTAMPRKEFQSYAIESRWKLAS